MNNEKLEQTNRLPLTLDVCEEALALLPGETDWLAPLLCCHFRAVGGAAAVDHLDGSVVQAVSVFT